MINIDTTYINITDLSYLDNEIHDSFLLPETVINEALELYIPQSIPFGTDGKQYAEIIRKKVGKKTVRRYVRENFPDFVERAKVRYIPGNDTALLMIGHMAMETMKKINKNFDPFSSPIKQKVIYSFLVNTKWWL